MKHQRPQSYTFGSYTVRRDPTNNIWRVFDGNSREVFSTAGANGLHALDAAIEFALNAAHLGGDLV